jgi:hypothetical protein
VASGLSEESFTPEGKGSFGMSPDQIQDEIAGLFQNPAFTDKLHPENERMIAKYEQLLSQLHGGTTKIQ